MLNPLPYSFVELLELELSFWVRYNRISSSINNQIVSQLMIQPDLDFQKFERKIKILNNFIVRNYSKYLDSTSLDISSESSECSVKNQRSGVNLSKLKSEESRIENLECNNYLCIIEEWLATLLFNIQIRNDQYLQEMIQINGQTASKSEQQTLENFIKNEIQKQMRLVLNMPVLLEIVEQKIENCKLSTPKNKKNPLTPQLQCLLQTLQYLYQQSQIQNDFSHQIKFFNQNFKKSQSILPYSQIQHCNSIIFQPQFFDNFCSILQDNYNFDLVATARIISANYLNQNQPRPLFSWPNMSKNSSGKAFLERTVRYMVDKYSKNEIFSQKIVEVDRVYTLFLTVFELYFFDVYLEWLSIIQPFLQSSLKKEQNLDFKNLNQAQQEIGSFLSNLTFSHPEFVKFLGTVNSILIEKYSSRVLSLEILKKLLLNRFLFNLSLFSAFEGMDEVSSYYQKQKIAKWFNQMRLLFYYQKLSNKILQKKGEIGKMKQIEQNFYKRLLKSVESNEKAIEKSLEGEKGDQMNSQIYLLDEHLKTQFEIIKNDMDFSQHKKNLKLKSIGPKSASSSSNLTSPKEPFPQFHSAVQNQKSLSFSFFGNEASFLSGATKKKSQAKRNIQNQSAAINYDQKPKTLTPIQSPKSTYTAKSHKTEQTRLSDHENDEKTSMDIVIQLVKIRREHGGKRREIEQRIQERKKKRKQLFEYCDKIHEQFMVRQKELEKTLNRIRINIQSY